MRSRSTSVFNKRPDTSHLKLPTSATPEDSEPELPEIPMKKAYSVGDSRDLFKEFGPMTADVKGKETFSGDFHKKLKTQTSLATDSTTMSFSLDNKVDFSTLILDDYFENTEREKSEKFFRGMIIGARGSGKHTLLDRMFNQKGKCSAFPKQAFDLVTKVVERVDSVERYHFWLKEPALEKSTTHFLLDVYYSTCSLFLFVYDPSNKETFDSLEEELVHISDLNKNNKEMFIILVGNKRGKERTSGVTYNDICTLKSKYKIMISLEVDFSQHVPNELRGFVERFLKVIIP